MNLKKFLIPFLLCSLFCFIPKTYASSIAISDENSPFAINIGNENWTGDNWFTVPANSERVVELHLYNYEGYSKPWTYLMTSGCVIKGYAHASYITNASATDSNFFDPNQFTAMTVETNQTCTINGNTGRIFYMQFRVGSYDDMDGTGEELIASSYLHMVNPIAYTVQFHFNTWYLSDDDILSSIKGDKTLLDAYNQLTQQSITNTNNIINNQNQNQQQTNDKLDDVNDNLGDVNDNLGDINDFLNDSNVNTNGLENSAGWLPAGPVDSILNLPLSLYENLLNTLQDGSSCPVLNINLPFIDEILPVPCLSDIFSKIDGLNVFWTWVGTISGAFLLFNYLLHLYKWVDDTLTLRENTHFGGY